MLRRGPLLRGEEFRGHSAAAARPWIGSRVPPSSSSKSTNGTARLAEPEDYRTTLYGAAYAKAMAELKVLADRHCHLMTASAAWARSRRG